MLAQSKQKECGSDTCHISGCSSAGEALCDDPNEITAAKETKLMDIIDKILIL